MRRHRWVLLAYFGLSLLLTWPMVAHFGTRVPGDGIDDPSLAWNLWWARHAFIDRPQNPFDAGWQFWPVGINLAFYTLTLLNGLLSIPIQFLFGVVPAYNLLLLASFVLGGYGAYLLCMEVMGHGVPASGRWFGPPGSEGFEGRPGPLRQARAGEAGRTRRANITEYGAFIGGALYAFASAKMFYAALGQGNVASSQWTPFAALYFVRAARPRGRRRDAVLAVLAALFLVFQAYAEQTYASFLLIFAGLVFAWGLPAWRSTVGAGLRTRLGPGGHGGLAPTWRGAVAGLLGRFALIAVLFAAGIAPFLLNMLPDLRAEGDFFSAGGGFADVFSADLAGYALPTQLHPILGGLTRAVSAQAHFPVDKGQQIFVGYSALALAVVGVAAARGGTKRSMVFAASAGRQPGQGGRDHASDPRFGAWFWAISALVFFLLTLGPTLRVAGRDTGLPLPFALVAQLPFFKGNRYPSRYSVMLLMSLAPLVAMGAAYLISSTSSWRLPHAASRVTHHASRFTFCGLLALVLFEHLSLPLPTFDLSVPALYQKVAEQPGDFALLELPPGWRNGARVLGKQDTIIMQELWYQTAHGKRLLGGNTSRNPEFKFQYFAEDPTLARLIGQTNAADLPQDTALRQELAGLPVTDADRARARSWAGFLSLRYVMVHRDKLPAETEALLRDLLPVTLVAEDGPLALYSLPVLPAPSRYDVGADQGRMALGEGWSPPAMDAPGAGEQSPAWAERSDTRLLLPLPAEATQVRLSGWAAGPGQRVTLVVNGRAAGEQAMSETPGLLTFDVPADAQRPLMSDVRLRFARIWSAAEAQASMAPQPRPPGPGASRLGPLLVRSAGSETGDFAHIYVDGHDLSPNGRGYNLVALPGSDFATGRLDSTKAIAATFDTHLDPSASARLAAWIAALPPSALVAGAVRDEGSMNLGADAVEALASLGVKGDLRGHFRWGHAFIGLKGALPGFALESLDGVRPAQTSTPLGLDAPRLAAAVTQVIVGK